MMDLVSLLVPTLARSEKFLFEDYQSEIENQKSEVEFVEAQTRAVEARDGAALAENPHCTRRD